MEESKKINAAIDYDKVIFVRLCYCSPSGFL